MRPLVLIGLVLLAVGGYVFYNGGSFSTRKEVLDVGGVVKVTTREEHQAPKWIAAVVAVVGLGLVVAGAARGGRS